MSRARLRRIISVVVLTMLAGLLFAAAYVMIHPIPVVLLFHSVVEPPQAFDISPAQFELLLDVARAAGRPVIVTTDASDRSVYETFAPDVEKHRFTGILFLMPPLIGRHGMLTWDQVRELDRAGLIIGSHTLTHPWLLDLSDEELWCELCTSKQVLEAETGHGVAAVAYPYGAFDERVKRVARQCGYTAAYATAPGRRVADDDPFAIKRVTIMDATAANPFLRWLALSGYWVTARETLLAAVPIEVPRKPQDWSYERWKTLTVGEDYRAFCPVPGRSGR